MGPQHAAVMSGPGSLGQVSPFVNRLEAARNGDGRRLRLGGERTMQHTDNVLQNCTPEAYIHLSANATQ